MQGASNTLDPGFQEFLETLPSGACLLDEEGRISGLNQQAAELLHVERSSLPGSRLADLLQSDGFEKFDQEVIVGGRTLVVRTADLPASAGRLCLLVDVSEYANARAAAERRADGRMQFLARLSHEIRSAVAGMIGFAEMLAEDITEANRDLAHIITLRGRNVMETLNSVMELAEIEFGNKELERRSIDVVSRLRQRVTLFRPAAEERGLVLDFRPRGDDISLDVNPNFLDRIVDNLVDNAIKYTREGKVEVEVEQRDGRVLVYVADTGIGMNRTFMRRLFSPFEREQREEVPDAEGVGLGLSAAQYFAELMGGRIYACSTRDVGTTFTVSFPAPEPERREGEA